MACNPNKKGKCLQGGFKQIPKNKNTTDSKGVLESFLSSREQCWKIDTGCWLLPNGGSWLLP